MEGFLVIAAIVGFIWFCSKISQANKEYEERKRREAADRWEEQQRRIREAQERKVAEERRKHEEYLQKRRTMPFYAIIALRLIGNRRKDVALSKSMR